MKLTLKKTVLTATMLLILAGCNEKNNESKTNKENDSVQQSNEAPQQVLAIQDEATSQKSNEKTQQEEIFENIEEQLISNTELKEAYAVGVSFGKFLKSSLERTNTKLDLKFLTKGVDDILNDNAKLNDEEVQNVLTALDTRLQEEAKNKYEKSKAESIKAGDEFRANFEKQPGVKKTDSGLLYQIIEQGNDKHPNESDTVVVHYSGTLVDGRKFDSSYDRGEPITFPLSGVIKGWTEGVQLIGVGGKIKLVIPAELAYGDEEKPAFGDNPGIPPASTLVFDVELLGIDDQENNLSE